MKCSAITCRGADTQNYSHAARQQKSRARPSLRPLWLGSVCPQRTPASPYLLGGWCSLAQPQRSCYPEEAGGRGSGHLCLTGLSAWLEGRCQCCQPLPCRTPPRGCMADCHTKMPLSGSSNQVCSQKISPHSLPALN